MHLTRKRSIGLAALALAFIATVSPARAGWRTADVGFANMERVCRDGAIVSMVSFGADAASAAGARRHDNLAAAPEPDKAFGGTGTPRPLDDFGPNIVADPALRAVTITTQPLAREVQVNAGNGAPDIVHSYGLVLLPWSSPQPVGTPVILVYQRNDGLDVGITEEVVADCTIGGSATSTIATSALPGGDSGIPSPQLAYQLDGLPQYGRVLRDNQLLGLGTRFTLADLAAHPLTYATDHTPLGDRLAISAFGTDLVSQITDRQANSFSANSPAISSAGRYVAFESLASTLVTGDTNTAHDIFVYDRQDAQTSRVSISSAGAQGNSGSTAAAISGDGRYVAFQSNASNLVDGDTNQNSDIFVRDRQSGQTSRVSVSSAGAQTNGSSTNPSISSDGRLVAFVSNASNLVDGDTNGRADVFVHDRQTGQTSRVSLGAGGAQANDDSDSPAISGNGQVIAFRSDATNLLGATADTNNASDIFTFDRGSGQTARVSVTSSGAQSNGAASAPAISSDGSAVAFASSASNLTATSLNGKRNIFLHTRADGQTRWVSHGLAGEAPDADSDLPSIAGDGRTIAFVSQASNLVGYDSKSNQDVFRYDLPSDTITCLSVSSAGTAADSSSTNPAISSDGRFTAIESYASNLLPTATVTQGDIYVRYYATAALVIGRPERIYIPLTER